MRDGDRLGTEAYVSIVLVFAILISIVRSLASDVRDESDMCARDMIYYLTPYQRQALLSFQSNPSFDDLSGFCKREGLDFSDILTARKNLSRFNKSP